MFSPSFTYKAYYYLFILLAFVIPIHNQLVSPIIALIGLNWILECNFRQKLLQATTVFHNRYLLAFGLLYLAYLVGVLYSEQLTGEYGALFSLQVKLSLLLFPIFIATIDLERLSIDFFKRILFAFILGTLVNSIIILNNAVYQYFIDHSMNAFFYTNLAMVYHPSYLSLFYSFAIAIIMTWLFKNFKRHRIKTFIAILVIIYLEIFIVLLSSKAGIIGLIILFSGIIIFAVTHIRERIKVQVIISAVMMGAFILIFLITPPSYERFYTAGRAVNSNSSTEADTLEGTVARMIIWQSSWEIIREHPVSGVGTGDVIPELLKKYQEKNVNIAAEKVYNAHNQYLQTYLSIGLIGFLLLIAGFLAAYVVALKKDNLLYFLMILVFMFHILVESMLERQAGVVFYAFFNAILFHYSMLGKNARSFL